MRAILAAFLEAQREAWTRTGLAYRGPADFVLRHGEWFEPRELPPEYEPGAPRACYGNAIIAAVRWDLAYVEGWALTPVLPLPVQHAWNADAAGGVVDTTWPPGGLAYLGCRFAVERADDCTWEGDQNVLDDWRRGWPLLKEPWLGERADWVRSERLRVPETGDGRALAAGVRQLFADRLAGISNDEWQRRLAALISRWGARAVIEAGVEVRLGGENG